MPEEIRISSFFSVISSDNHSCIIARYSEGFQGIKQTIPYFDIIIGIKKEVFIVSRTYIAIDLKSFYASVECRERGLDALTTHLVVADASRTDKTICLAVSPSLKAYGVPGRPRLFEVIRQVRELNAKRLLAIPNHVFTGATTDDMLLRQHPDWQLDYITAVPRMSLYMAYSTRIYQIYLHYVAPEDIHVYSIDEVFMDVTAYLPMYGLTARQLTERILRHVLKETGITATAGIGTNLYLAKIAMDIEAKHMAPDANGARIAALNEYTYREKLWLHQPLTDFWRIGTGYAVKLIENGLCTMYDIARCSLEHEDFLFRLFGVNAELLIDHSWGYEPCTLAQIKAYKPRQHSLGAGQVLHCPYDTEKGRLIVWEMTDLLSLDLVDKQLLTEQLVLTIGYDRKNLHQQDIPYTGPTVCDHYGRRIPKHAHGTIHLGYYTSSSKALEKAMLQLYDKIITPGLWIRRVQVVAANVQKETEVTKAAVYQAVDLFAAPEPAGTILSDDEARERKRQRAILQIQKKYGKNALIKGRNFEAGAMTRERNGQVGGHKA